VTSVRVRSDGGHSRLYEALTNSSGAAFAGLRLTHDEPDVDIVIGAQYAQSDIYSREHAHPLLIVGPLADDDSPVSSRHEIRLRARPLGEIDDVIVYDRVMALSESSGEPLVTANIGYQDLTVATVDLSARIARLGVGLDPNTWHQPAFLRLIHRLLHRLSGVPSRPSQRVGLLGYGAIGHEHAKAINITPGLELTSVCDTSPDRLAAALAMSEGITTTHQADDIVRSSEVDVVVVSTPPDTHAAWALTLLEHGKHVVLEKPMALTAAECDAVLAAARAHDRLAVVYQNRRFDPDFRALKSLVDAGELGDVFHLEAFVGGFQHPCNYWHSDSRVSGGALFDWGSHVIDQIVQLMPGEIHSVSARNHKLVWHDVTNADQARMTLHYADGREATFIYSDIAAAMKPRWYLSGTRGGVIGTWRHERVVNRSAIGTLDEDVLAPADSPPQLTLYSADGRVSDVPGEPAPIGAFHRELSAYLAEGLPMSVRAEESRRVVALLEAAEISASNGGAPVPVA
jgi:scyllo-inositol 2-dehydrogenase (NADP+)